MAHSQLLHLSELFLPLADGVEGAFHLPEKDFPCFRQSDPSGGTQKQSGVQILLQTGNRFADGRLADKKLPCRPGYIPAFGHRIKNMV